MVLFSHQALKICTNIPVKKRNITKFLHPSKKHTNIHSKRWWREPAALGGGTGVRGRPGRARGLSRTRRRLADRGTDVQGWPGIDRGPSWTRQQLSVPGRGTGIWGRPGVGRGTKLDRAAAGDARWLACGCLCRHWKAADGSGSYIFDSLWGENRRKFLNVRRPKWAGENRLNFRRLKFSYRK
jgi:hypothetical protein